MNRRYFNPIRYVERYFWSFKEVLEGGGEPSPDFLYDYQAVQNVIGYMVSDYGYSTPIWDSVNEVIKPEYREVLTLIVKRYLDHYCFYTDTPEVNEDKCLNFIGKLVNMLVMTAPRYLKLLEVYTGASATLMSPVEISTSGITRFNDTPQDEGDFANDEHTTNLTEDNRTTSNDMDTKMGRIREIESNYNNIILNWSNEFEGLFIEEANIQ